MKEPRTVVWDDFAGPVRRVSFFDPRGDSREDEDEPQPHINVGIEPTLMLRRSGPDLWSGMVEIPDFGGVATFDPDYRGFLRTTRCKILGTGDTWLPAGSLLYGPQMGVLNT